MTSGVSQGPVHLARRQRARTFALVGLCCAVSGGAGSLMLSLSLGLRACPLCFYQRAFVLAAFAILGLGLWVERSRPGLICLLALPPAWAGLGVAAFHEYLVLSGALECPLGLLGLGTAPAQSLTAFALLASTCTLGALAGRDESLRQGPSTPAAALAGLALAYACAISSPPLPAAPSQPYDPVRQPLDTCRPPFRGA